MPTLSQVLPPLDESSAQPLYQQLQRALREAIEKRVIAPDDALPPERDLAEMLNLVADRPDLCPNPVERSLLAALAEQRRSDLQTACRILGRRVYAETPESLEVRFAAYWEAAEMAHDARLSVLAG